MDGHADKDALEKQKLKELLIQDELERLDKIEQKLKDSGESAEKVSNVIAEAIAMRSGKDNMLSKALEPVVESSIKQTIDKKPQDFVNILFPLIGSTIRKSISETLNTMLSGFSRGLEQSFSLQCITWRI